MTGEFFNNLQSIVTFERSKGSNFIAAHAESHAVEASGDYQARYITSATW